MIGFLPQQAWAEAGAAGFEDVVANINPITGDQPDPAGAWSVTFGVDDTDAKKAGALGGKVIVPPSTPLGSG